MNLIQTLQISCQLQLQHSLEPLRTTMKMTKTHQCWNMRRKMKSTTVRKRREIFLNGKEETFRQKAKKNVYFYKFFSFSAVLGVNICLIFFGWVLAIASLLLVYGTFKRQSRLLVPYLIALFGTVLVVILLEVLPEFIDNLGVGWFLLLNLLIGK